MYQNSNDNVSKLCIYIYISKLKLYIYIYIWSCARRDYPSRQITTRAINCQTLEAWERIIIYPHWPSLGYTIQVVRLVMPTAITLARWRKGKTEREGRRSEKKSWVCRKGVEG